VLVGEGVLVAVANGVVITTSSSPQPTSVTDENEINNDANNRHAQIVIKHFFINLIILSLFLKKKVGLLPFSKNFNRLLIEFIKPLESGS